MRAMWSSLCFFILLCSATAEAKDPFVRGEFLVKLKEAPSRRALDKVFPRGEPRFIDTAGKLLFVKNEKSSKALRKRLTKASLKIEYIEPNFIYSSDGLPNDPQLQLQWGLNNSGQIVQEAEGKAGVDIGAEKGWELSTGSRDVVVAVVDTGIATRNTDLANNLWTNEAEVNGKAGVDDDGNGFVDDVHGYDFFNQDGDPRDDNGHGTHVAGVIGAEANNANGIVGVTWKVRLMAVKFLGAGGSGTTEKAIRAIRYAVERRVHVINASWGGGEYSKALEEALQEARDKNILVVASAGNRGQNTDTAPAYPASYGLENIVSVAAVNNQGSLADFSNYGAESVDLAAPGVGVLSYGLKGTEYLSGTSMAAPHVSGAAVLLLARESGLAPKKIRERLISTSRPLEDLKNKTVSGGILNLPSLLSNNGN